MFPRTTCKLFNPLYLFRKYARHPAVTELLSVNNSLTQIKRFGKNRF